MLKLKTAYIVILHFASRVKSFPGVTHKGALFFSRPRPTTPLVPDSVSQYSPQIYVHETLPTLMAF